MGKVRIELNSSGIRALLRSPEMQAVLKDRADTVRPLPARPMTTTRPTTPC